MSPRSAAGQAAKNPYRGLSAFQVDETDLFFGRDELTERLWQRFKALYEQAGSTRLLAVLGPSGSGKSSVARAGLLAELQTAPIPGPDPLQSIAFKPGNIRSACWRWRSCHRATIRRRQPSYRRSGTWPTFCASPMGAANSMGSASGRRVGPASSGRRLSCWSISLKRSTRCAATRTSARPSSVSCFTPPPRAAVMCRSC